MVAKITVLGTGRMGSALARRLAEVGFELTLWDRTAERAKAVEIGRVAASPAEAVEDAELVISSLTGPEALRATYLGPNGALEGAHGQLFLEMSTAGPEFEAELAPRVALTGSYLVDATIVGAPPIVEQGDATILVGGDAAHVEQARPVLAHFGTVRHVGQPGNGARLRKRLLPAACWPRSLPARRSFRMQVSLSVWILRMCSGSWRGLRPRWRRGALPTLGTSSSRRCSRSTT